MRPCQTCGKAAFGVSGRCSKCIAATQAEQGQIGMEQSVARADRAVDGWSEIALKHLRDFAAAHTDSFLAEEIAPWAYEQGCPPAPDDRAWGHVVKKGGNQGYIMQTGLAAKNRLSGNASTWRPLWRAV